MREFFHGWRRKAGVVTLVMALGLMGGWVRSFGPPDLMLTLNGTGSRSVNRFSAKNASFVWEHVQSNWQVKFAAQFLLLFDESRRVSIPMSAQDESIQWDWNFCGFANGKHYEEKLGNTRLSVWKIPCWSITIPLTLLSVYLLLVPARKRPPTASQPHA